MAIQDSNPERRNLSLTALAFVAYYLAGGTFEENTIRLQVINVSFNQPEYLAILAWLIFAWFFYRYWLTNRDQFAAAFNSEIQNYKSKKRIRKYIEDRIGETLISNVGESTSNESGKILDFVAWNNGKFFASVADGQKIRRGSDGSIETYTRKHKNNSEVAFDNFSGWLHALHISTLCAYRYPSFSNYIFPYLLALFALCLAIYESAF